MPSTTIDISSWSHISSLKLADPSCHKPSPVDVLLGAEIFASLLLPGNIVGTRTQPSAINSVFGWLLTARGRKRVHQIANEHAESVTVVGCGNAIGSAIPPMILFKGKRLKPEYQDNLPPSSLVKMTPKERLYINNPDAIPEEAFAPPALSELTVPSNRENITVFSDALREQATSTGNVENSDGSGTDTENLPVSLLSKNKSPNSGTPNKINKQSTTAQEVTKDLFSDNATNSTSQITVPFSRVEDVPGTSSMMKISTKTPKLAVTGFTSAQPAVAATP
ncbi:unnamed protein product [Leptosia nina]|uniref:Uncharacterized protein n=1 Tax=Leptosia nina TaxID=320188 RepID=A0AAV1K304_9NEOP